MGHSDPVCKLHLKHLYSFSLFQKAVQQIFLVLTSLEREFLPTHMAWKAEGMLLLGAACVHKAVFFDFFFFNYFRLVSCFALLNCQRGKGKTDLHSSLLLVLAVKCIQVAKWRFWFSDLRSCWHRTVVRALKLKSGGLSCPAGGMAVLVSTFLGLMAGRACPSDTWTLRALWPSAEAQELSTLSLLQCKSSFARMQGSSTHGPAGACSKSRSKSCISLVGHCHLHVTSDGWSLSQCCLLSVCLSFLDNVKTLELWFLSASRISIISEGHT